MTRHIRIKPAATPPHAYDAVIGAGVLPKLAELVRDAAPAARYALITDDVVNELHTERVHEELRAGGLDVMLYSFPSGEPYKTRETWSYLSDRMSADGLGRDACVIAMGGGVVCDVGGFVAATYLRGVPCVQVPTTLLSMLDASIGGKTGVDTDHGKNLIGSFHQPRLVVMDPSVVWTQEYADMIAGAAEAVKHGAIMDAEYLTWIDENASALKESDTDILTQLVVCSVERKSEIVERDPFEHGERAILNFGHTVAHALELATHYRVSHGHAVSRGMVAEARIGERLGVTAAGTTSHIKNSLERLGLPTDMPKEISVEQLIGHAAGDKKNRAGRTRCVLLECVGRVARAPDGGWTWDVGSDLSGLLI
ncbi:MAG: 3-dehydroquinate synthase [Longimicrobiales bacterium]